MGLHPLGTASNEPLHTLPLLLRWMQCSSSQNPNNQHTSRTPLGMIQENGVYLVSVWEGNLWVGFTEFPKICHLSVSLHIDWFSPVPLLINLRNKSCWLTQTTTTAVPCGIFLLCIGHEYSTPWMRVSMQLQQFLFDMFFPQSGENMWHLGIT